MYHLTFAVALGFAASACAATFKLPLKHDKVTVPVSRRRCTVELALTLISRM